MPTINGRLVIMRSLRDLFWKTFGARAEQRFFGQNVSLYSGLLITSRRDDVIPTRPFTVGKGTTTLASRRVSDAVKHQGLEKISESDPTQ